MFSTIHQKQSSKVKTAAFISMTTKVNIMTLKRGWLQPVQIPNLEVQKFQHFTVSVSVMHSINILIMYTENVCSQVATGCTLSPRTYTTRCHAIYLGCWMLTGGTRDCSSQLMARLERSGGGIASTSSLPFTGASGTCTSSRTKNVLNQKWNSFSCKGNKKLWKLWSYFTLCF